MTVANGWGEPGSIGGVVDFRDRIPSIQIVVAVIMRIATTPRYMGPEISIPIASQTAYKMNGPPNPIIDERMNCTDNASD